MRTRVYGTGAPLVSSSRTAGDRYSSARWREGSLRLRLAAYGPVREGLYASPLEHELITPAERRTRGAERVLAEGLRVEQRVAKRARDEVEPNSKPFGSRSGLS
jgi:hypothetical protein